MRGGGHSLPPRIHKQMKLVRSEPFISGLSKSEVRPFGANVLKYEDKYYQISDQRIPYRRDKTEDDRFFILTLFGISQIHWRHFRSSNRN